jgi:hypothetical protein
VNRRFDRVEVEAAPAVRVGCERVLRPAHHRAAHRDDPIDEIRPLARRFARDVATEAPSDQTHPDSRLARDRCEACEHAGQQVANVAGVTSERPTARVVAEHAQVAP